MVAFAFSYGMGMSLLAETRALHDGLAIAYLCGIRLMEIYSDCAVLVEACRKKEVPCWMAFPWWNKILSFLRGCGCQVQHIFREGNQVADSLASYACNRLSNFVFVKEMDLPRAARGALRVDRMGLPTFRL